MSARPPMPASTHTPAAPGWWGRNWKWFVPVVLVSLLALLVAFVALILFVASTSMKSSDVYRDAYLRASTHAEVVAAIGDPIEAGFMPSGSVSSSTEGGGSGRADLVISLEGPRGSGQVIAAADRKLGSWVYESLLFVPDDAGAVELAPAETQVGPMPASTP